MSHTETGRGIPAIEISGLSKSYGSHQVLRDLDLRVTERVHALLGPNGAGKTTLINILSTLIKADSGTARIFGLDLPGARAQIRRHISVTGQFAAVDAALTGRQNLVMMGRLLGLGARAATSRGDDLLAQFDLTDAATKPVDTYSGGMRRRLDIAISMITTPSLLFLDEPTTGLDTRARQALWDQIRSLSEAGTTVFLTTQYLEEADILADRISVLDGGRIIAQGTPSQLKASAGGAVVQAHDGAGHLLSEVTTDGTAQAVSVAVAQAASTHPDAQVSVRRPSLDEVFLQLTHDPAHPDRTTEGALS